MYRQARVMGGVRCWVDGGRHPLGNLQCRLGAGQLEVDAVRHVSVCDGLLFEWFEIATLLADSEF